MLLDQEAEARIEKVIEALGGSVATYLTGRDLGQGLLPAIESSISTRKMTPLEESFLAGRISSILGPGEFEQLELQDLTTLVQANNVQLTEKDNAQLKGLRDDTSKWIKARTDDWKKTFNQTLATEDKDWRAELAQTSTQDAHTRSALRTAALAGLTGALAAMFLGFKDQVHRLVATEAHAYFQAGQASEWGGDTLVYKLPRPNACVHCMRLHLRADGHPKLYKLSEVAGNSNIGQPASAWDFTIGPTHPHCYCTLYSAEQSPPSASKTRAAQRAAVLNPPLPTPSTQPNTATQLQKGVQDRDVLELHHRHFFEALEQIYSGEPIPK